MRVGGLGERLAEKVSDVAHDDQAEVGEVGGQEDVVGGFLLFVTRDDLAWSGFRGVSVSRVGAVPELDVAGGEYGFGGRGFGGSGEAGFVVLEEGGVVCE